MTTIIGGRRAVSRIIYLVSLLLLLTACGPEPEKKTIIRPVKAGDMVARIDPTDYETAIRTLEGQREREQAIVKRARADVARNDRIRKKDPGAISQAAIDRSRQALDSANARVRSLRASVETARDQLNYTVLKAPFGGVVVETYTENFETVVTKQPILRPLNPGGIEFVISVPENLIGLAPYVESMLVKFDALPGIDVPAAETFRLKERVHVFNTPGKRRLPAPARGDHGKVE